MRPLVSIVVPVLADAGAAGRLITQIPPDAGVEIVIADGASDRELDRIAAARADVRLVRSAPGRGRQMNTGAAIATGDWLLFLHADSELPRNWLQVLRNAVGMPGSDDDGPPEGGPHAERPHGSGPHGTPIVGGWFRFALDDDGWQARAIERGVAWRVRVLRLPYGDQGLFVRRLTFDAIGGFPDWPLMEDVDFARRLIAAGRIAEVDAALVTSARRWRQDGWWRRSARNVALLALYVAGVSPERLARWYGRNPAAP